MGYAVQAVRETAAERWGETEAGSYEPHGSREPPSEADPRDELGDEIARLAAHMHAYRHRYQERVAEFDRRRGGGARPPHRPGSTTGRPPRL